MLIKVDLMFHPVFFVLSRSCNNLNFFRFIPNVIGAIAEKMLPGDEWFDFFHWNFRAIFDTIMPRFVMWQ